MSESATPTEIVLSLPPELIDRLRAFVRPSAGRVSVKDEIVRRLNASLVDRELPSPDDLLADYGHPSKQEVAVLDDLLYRIRKELNSDTMGELYPLTPDPHSPVAFCAIESFDPDPHWTAWVILTLQRKLAVAGWGIHVTGPNPALGVTHPTIGVYALPRPNLA